MLRKALPVLVAGLVLVFVGGVVFAQDDGAATGRRRRDRESFRERHGAGFENLPDAKKQAIKRVLEWVKTKTREVLANDDLTREQKRERIARIHRIGREKIRKILGRGHRHRGRDSGDGEDAPVEGVE